jgi:hypothetical protein
VVQVALAVQAVVLDLQDREEHAQDLALVPDSVHDLVRQAVYFPRVKHLQRVALLAVLLRAAAATSVTRRPKKAR